MSTLEINDIFETYYEGRERFPHLPEPSDTVKDEKKQRRELDRSMRKPTPRASPPTAATAA